MSLQVYINGKFFAKEDAKVSVYDHGLLYGDGVFEGMRSYDGVVFRLTEHLDRLWNSAGIINVIVFDHDHIVQAKSVVNTSSYMNGPLFKVTNLFPFREGISGP